MKQIVQLNSKYADALIQYDPFQRDDVLTVLNVMEVSDLPETVCIGIVHNYVEVGATVTIPRDIFVNLLRHMTANEHKIPAIKLVRDVMHWGLKESKDFVESL